MSARQQASVAMRRLDRLLDEQKKVQLPAVMVVPYAFNSPAEWEAACMAAQRKLIEDGNADHRRSEELNRARSKAT